MTREQGGNKVPSGSSAKGSKGSKGAKDKEKEKDSGASKEGEYQTLRIAGCEWFGWTFLDSSDGEEYSVTDVDDIHQPEKVSQTGPTTNSTRLSICQSGSLSTRALLGICPCGFSHPLLHAPRSSVSFPFFLRLPFSDYGTGLDCSKNHRRKTSRSGEERVGLCRTFLLRLLTPGTILSNACALCLCSISIGSGRKARRA